MNPDNPNDPSLADAAHVTAADGGATVDSSTLSLTELNSFLGKSFTDKDTALASLKETFSFVGKRQADIERDVRAKLATEAGKTADPDLKAEVSSLRDRVFFSENPQFKGYESIIRKMGSDPAEVVESPEFKSVFEKGKVADEVSQTRSVVASSARVGQSASVTQEAVKIANATGSTEATAEALARGIGAEMRGE
jgi:hypothetical protein